MTIKCVTNSPQDTADLGAALSERLQCGDVLLLTGDLGAGKSVLARGIARGLGVTCAMPSPTFTLMQPYVGRVKLYHFDLYRLEDEDEFWQAGLEEYIAGDGVALVEWPDRVDFSPYGRIEITIDRTTEEESRLIAVQCIGLGEREGAIKNALSQWATLSA